MTCVLIQALYVLPEPGTSSPTEGQEHELRVFSRCFAHTPGWCSWNIARGTGDTFVTFSSLKDGHINLTANFCLES